MAVASSYVKNNTHGTITLLDAAITTPNSMVTTPFDRGDLSISGLGARLNDLVLVHARGKHISPAWGNRRYPTFTFTFWMSNVVGSSASQGGTIVEFMTGKGGWASNTNTAGTNRPWACDLRLDIEGTSFGDAADEQILLNDVNITFDFAESVDGDTVSISGTVMGPVVITNASNAVTFGEISSPAP